jgi:hypothetical protein
MCTGDHVATPAIVAEAAAGDVIDDRAVTFLELLAVGADGDDLPARLVSGDDALVALRAFAKMLMVDAPDVGAADGGGFDAQENFSAARTGHGVFAEPGRAIAREDGTLHLVGNGYAHIGRLL